MHLGLIYQISSSGADLKRFKENPRDSEATCFWLSGTDLKRFKENLRDSENGLTDMCA